MKTSKIADAISHILHGPLDIEKLATCIELFQNTWHPKTGLSEIEWINQQMHTTPNGRALSTFQAANCLMDTLRTTKFLRAIHRAIEHYLKSQTKVNILYAGCGPYASLLTPFTSIYSKEQLQLTFIDIDPVSYQAVTTLYENLDLSGYLKEIIHGDATAQSLTFREPFDLIVSETMQTGLQTECQVSIVKNLNRFLRPDGTFIPQQIDLLAYLTNTAETNDENLTKLSLGIVFQLDPRNTKATEKTTTLIPDKPDLNYLQIETIIHLYEDIKLETGESGLTIPLTIDHLINKPRSIQFSYQEGANPGLKMDYNFDQES